MGHPARLSPSCYLGRALIFLTIVTHRRRVIFRNSENVAFVLSQFLQTARTHMFAVLAYCFMPDHLHALVGATTDEADFRQFIRIAKQRSSYHFVQTRGERLWRPSFFDRTVRPNEDPIDVMRYIVMNPLRAGIVRDPREYAFWGSELYEREELLEYVGGERTPVPWT